MLIATSAAALALTVSPPAVALMPQVDPPLKALDPNVGDVNPLSASFRDTRVDLRQPSGFTSVYRVPGQPGMLMRGSGALYAVFPNSQYVRSPIGPLARVPSGTVYYIGLPPADSADAQVAPESETDNSRVSNRVDSRVQGYTDSKVETYIQPRLISKEADSDNLSARVTQRPASPVQTGARTAAESLTVANNEEFRIRRLGELLERALEAVTDGRETGSETPVAKAGADQR
jgi:hypothetical protein